MNQVPNIKLNNGTLMPQLGFGVWQVPDAEAERVVGDALECIRDRPSTATSGVPAGR